MVVVLVPSPVPLVTVATINIARWLVFVVGSFAVAVGGDEMPRAPHGLRGCVAGRQGHSAASEAHGAAQKGAGAASAAGVGVLREEGAS